MSDVIKYAHSSITGFQNGRVVTCVQKNGDYKVMPSGTMVINSYVPSGTMFDRLGDRFDEHYGGGAS